MERANRILKHPTFCDCIEKNKMAEADRRFCHHNMEHFMDVARIAMILNLQEQLGYSEDVIYGAALLHDIGRHIQYADGTPHEIASAKLAPDILADCGYSEEESREILEAIRSHRDAQIREKKNLQGILYRADKASRGCYFCEAEAECNWKGDKKNREIIY